MKFSAFLILLLLVTITTNAQLSYSWKEASSAGYTYKYVTNDPMKARFYTLKNGLTVILSPNKKEPRIAARIAIRAGSNTDPKDHTGLAHYLEHLLFKGTAKFGSLDWKKEKPLLDKIDALYEKYNSTTDSISRKEIYREIDSTSGEAAKFAIANEYDHMMTYVGSQTSNAHTWVEETVYEEDLPTNAVDKFLAIQSERLKDPIFRIFHTELEAVYEEKNRSLDNDNNKVLEAALAAIFPTHNYGQQTTIGTVEHLKNPSLKAIREYFIKYYVPNNMAVVMAGDFEPDQLIKKIDQAFSFMKPKPFEEYIGPIEQPVAGPIVKEVVGPNAEFVRIVFRTPADKSKEKVLADVLSRMLYNGKAGMMDLNLNKQQKVLASSAFIYQFKDYGVMFLSGTPKQGQTLEEMRDLLFQQINLLKKGEFEESLLKASAANMKLSMLQAIEQNGFRVESVTDEFIKSRGEGWRNSLAEADEIARLTKKEVIEYANKFFGENNYAIIFKRKGEDKSIMKVDKPKITPVETNAGKSSPFVQSITGSPLPALKPVWIDYTKDLQKGQLEPAEVLYVPNTQNTLFRLSYRFQVGKYNNPLLPMALAYLEYLGTDKYSAEQISKEFYNLACNFTSVPGNDQTVVTISGLQENFTKAVTLFEDLLRNCKQDTVALRDLINRELKSRANRKLNKGAIAGALQSYASYGPKNPTNFVLTNDELSKISATDLINLLHSLANYQHYIGYYGPKPLTALTSELKTLHKLPSAWTPAPTPMKFTQIKQTNNQVLFANYDAVQADIFWVKTLESYDPQLEATVNLFNSYFGEKVFQTIREAKALAYSTYGFVGTPGKKEDSYSITAYVGAQADKMNEAIAGMNELLTDLPKTAESYENSRASLRKDLETQRITQDDIISAYLSAKRKGLDYDLRKETYAKYAALKLDDIAGYHQKEFSKQPFTYCVVASNKRINLDDLKKYGELKVLSLDELFGY